MKFKKDKFLLYVSVIISFLLGSFFFGSGFILNRFLKILEVIFFVLGIIFYSFLVNNICLHKQINLYLLGALTIQ